MLSRRQHLDGAVEKAAVTDDRKGRRGRPPPPRGGGSRRSSPCSLRLCGVAPPEKGEPVRGGAPRPWRGANKKQGGAFSQPLGDRAGGGPRPPRRGVPRGGGPF